MSHFMTNLVHSYRHSHLLIMNTLVPCTVHHFLWVLNIGMIQVLWTPFHLASFEVLHNRSFSFTKVHNASQIFQKKIPGRLEVRTLEVNKIGEILRNAMSHLLGQLGSLSYQQSYYGWNKNLVLIPYLCGWQINLDLYFITDMTVLIFIQGGTLKQKRLSNASLGQNILTFMFQVQ